MTIEEANKIITDHNIDLKKLSKYFGCYYKFEILQHQDTELFIEKVKDFKNYIDLRYKLSTEVTNWLKDNNLGQSLKKDFDLNLYLKSDIININDLEEGYYLGKCRNTIIAYWDKDAKIFKHTKDSFNIKGIDTIPHIQKPNYNFDMFIPIRKLKDSELSENDKIDKWEGNHVKHSKIIYDK